METKTAETRTAETVTISCTEYAEFLSQKEQILELTQKLDWLMEHLRLSGQKRFGPSSEKTNEDGYEQLNLLFNEAEVNTQPEKEETVTVAAHARKRKSGSVKDIVPEDIPVEVVEHRLPEEELSCPKCGTEMMEIGKEVRRTLEIIPARVYVREDRYYAYACRKCQNEEIETPIVKTPKEPALILGSFASASVVAHIAAQKFVMGSPLYRQEQEWKRQEVLLTRQTMSNWLLRCADDYGKPVYAALHRQMLKHEVLHGDETTLQVLHEPGKTAQSKSYLWLYRTGRDAKHPVVLYEYCPDRKQEHPRKFLAGFKGYLHTDGYGGYHNLPESITVVGCWAHARRKFDEAVKALGKGKAKNSLAAQGLAYCTHLFKIEERLVELSPQKRYDERLKQAKPVLDAMLAWANTTAAAPKSALGRALTYLKDQWPYLVNYLKDGRLELSNNRAERSIKPFVIGRKNFLFANTPNGAQGSAVIFSLTETAKENGLDPYRYLSWLLSCAPKMDLSQPDQVRLLLPWNAPTQCRTGKEHK